MIGSPLPSWKQLFGLKKNKQNSPFYFSERTKYLKRSEQSLQLIINAFRSFYGAKKIKISVPAFFCYTTLSYILDDDIEVLYYPITDTLDPDWEQINVIEENADIFLFVHFFGKYHDISIARKYCNDKHCFLIEDCAHVLFEDGQFGQQGDFVIYSPHKQLPLPEGAILRWNEGYHEKVLELVERFESFIQGNDSRLNWGWRVKKLIQKVLKIGKSPDYKNEVHYANNVIKREHDIEKVSDYAYKNLLSYSREEILRIREIRRDNFEVIKEFLLSFDKKITFLNDSLEAPYFLAADLRGCDDKKDLLNILSKSRLMLLFWPDLDPTLQGKEEFVREKEISKNILLVPIHQSIQSDQLIFSLWEKNENEDNNLPSDIQITWLKTEEHEQEYKSLYSLVQKSNIPQDFDYGKVKSDDGNWKVRRGIIKSGEDNIGVIQILEKKILFFLLVRLNRGPLFLEGINTEFATKRVLLLLRNRYPHPIPIFYNSNEQYSIKNIVGLRSIGYRRWNSHTYSSALVDLTMPEEVIVDNLKKNWKKRYKKGLKNRYVIKSDIEKFKTLLDLYEQDQENRGFQGISRHILETLVTSMPDSLKFYYIEENNGEIISLFMIYSHGHCATSIVGWNSEKGRDLYLNNVLYMHAILEEKKCGKIYFDIGGIDDVYTEGVAEYKRGIRGQEYRLLGEFFNI
jgi:femAB family protein